MSAAELYRLGLSYEDISADNPGTLMLLSGIVKKVCPNETQKSSGRSSRLNIEVFHSKDGGCIFYISPNASMQRPSRIKAVITVSSVEALLEVCKELDNSGIDTADSILAGESSCLRLITQIPSNRPSLGAKLMRSAVLSEAGDAELAHIREHGSIIIPSDAVKRLLCLQDSR